MVQTADAAEIDSLLARAPGNPLLWQQFLGRLTRQLNCDTGALVVTDRIERENTHFLYCYNIPPEYRQKYENHLNRLDIFNYYLSKNPQRVFCSQALQPPGLEDTEQTLGPKHPDYRFGLSIPCNQRHSLNLLINRDTRFNDREQQYGQLLLQGVLTPLQNAIHAEQLHKINSQLILYLGGRFDAYLIIDRELNILYSDPVYAEMIGTLDCVNLVGNKFGMKNSLIEQRLLHSIADKREEFSIHNQCHSCQIRLIPIASLENLYHWECCKDAFVLAFTLDNDRNPALDRLAEIYELSRCEAICALNFMNNPSIPDVAASTCRSQETVRNHIKHTMQKMQVHNQAALMKKLIALSSL